MLETASKCLSFLLPSSDSQSPAFKEDENPSSESRSESEPYISLASCPVYNISQFFHSFPMNQSENNKKYIRDNIEDDRQTAFYDYFIKLEDHHLFDQWNTLRIMQVVEGFKRMERDRPEEEEQNAQGKKEDAVIEEIAVQISPKKDNQLGTPEFKHLRSASVGKKEENLDFLKDLDSKFLNSPSKNTKQSNNAWKNVEDNIWLNFQTVKVNHAEKKSTVADDPFENFGSCILSSSVTLQKTKPFIQEPPKTPPCVPQLFQKIQLKRSQQIKPSSSELKKSKTDLKGDLKQKRPVIADKIFKRKLLDELPCKKLQPKLENVSISITSHEMVHRTLLPDYAIYHINVEPSRRICKRTFDDFVDLRNIMEKMYPGVKVPCLDSGSWFSESDIALINKNKINLEMFLNDIIDHPTLSRSHLINEFLSITEQKILERTLEDYNKIPIRSSFADLANEDGILTICLSEESNKVIEQLPKWKKIFENYFERHCDLVGNLASQFESLKYTYTQLMTLSSDFQNKIRQLSQVRTVMDFEGVEGLLDKQVRYFGEKSKSMEKQITGLKEKYQTFLKYEKLNVVSFESTIESVHAATEKYLKRLDNQPESPSSQLQNSQIPNPKEKFNSDIWHESTSMPLFKYQLGYLNAQLLQESKIFNTNLAKNMEKTWNCVFQKEREREREKSRREPHQRESQILA